MKTKIATILVCMLLFATVFSVAGNEKNEQKRTDANPNPVASFIPQSNRAEWDVQFWFDCAAASGAGGNAGTEFDGTYFYSTRWAANLIHKYDINGNLVQQFSIPGVSGLRDLAYDGEYFYGGNAGNAIYQMDFDTQTLVGTIPSSSVQVRAIAYDEINDAFYVSNWNDPVGLVARDGTTLDTFSVGVTSTYGFAYDRVTAGGPYLWIYDQGGGAGMPQYIHQWDLAGGTLTGVQHDTSLDFGSGSGIAGGLFFATDYEEGYATIGGLYQDSDAPGVGDYIFCYEYGEVIPNDPPEKPSTPDGETAGEINVEYAYTTSTTDPDEDALEYLFDWGNGDDSGWVGPYASGATAEASYTWTSPGEYEVKVKARDELQFESPWSDPLTVTITAPPEPDLKITAIEGGTGITVTVENTGDADATNIAWTITITGGFIVIPKDGEGTITSIAAGESDQFTMSVFGIGLGIIFELPEITASVTCDEESSDQDSEDAKIFLNQVTIQ